MRIVKLGTLLKEVCDKTTCNNQYEVLTSSQRGLFGQEEYFTKQVASQDNTGYKIIRKGQFTYRSMSDTGRFYINRLTNRDIGIVSPAYPVFEIVSDELYPEYLETFFKSSEFQRQIENKSTGSTRLALKYSKLITLDIVLPDINVQKNVVDNISKISAAKERAEHLIELYDELIKARFVEMFGSFDLALQKAEWVPISQIGTVVGGSTPKTGVAEYWDGEYRWISPAELKADSGIIYDSVKKITKAGVDSCSLQELPIGTVILSSRAPIGKVAIAGNTFYCNQGFKNIICNDRVLPRYLYTLLLFNTEYLNSLGRGATFKEISKAIVENIRIPLPSLDRQQRFDSFVAQVDKSKFVAQKEIDLYTELLNKMMDKYFNGETS